MCLLLIHSAEATLNQDDIAQYWGFNQDGLGVMYSEDSKLVIKKCLPNSGEAAWEFYQAEIQGRKCVVHFRMKTHGQINNENCHPYTIFGDDHEMPMAMAHNGILSQGNDKDRTKSDTWWYVQNTLIPLLNTNPGLFNNPAFIDVIEGHIGHGNRFALMNHLGDMAIMNEYQFVSHKGCLYSNLYAWDSKAAGFGLKTKTNTGYGSYAAWNSSLLDDDYEDNSWRGHRLTTTGPRSNDDIEVYEEEEVKGQPLTEQEREEAFLDETAREVLLQLDFMNYEDIMADLEYEDVRGFLDVNGEDLLWDAVEALHGQVITSDEFYIYVINGSRSAADPLRLTVDE